MSFTPNELFIQNATAQKDPVSTSREIAALCDSHDWVNPRLSEEILDSLHRWFIALKDNQIVGCFEQMPINEEYTELGAFIVTQTRQGIGPLLLAGFNHFCPTKKALAICNQVNPAAAFFKKNIGPPTTPPHFLQESTRDLSNRVLFAWEPTKKIVST